MTGIKEGCAMKEKLLRLTNTGRVIYGIMCLENAIIFYDCDRVCWQNMLKRLWSLANADRTAHRLEELVRRLPGNVSSQAAPFYQNDRHSVSPWELEELRSLYSGSPEPVKEIVEIIYDAAACTNYKPNGTAEEQTRHIEKIAGLSEAEGFPLPDAEEISAFEAMGKIDARRLSRIVSDALEPEALPFADVSIRGRVAYGIRCLESFIERNRCLSEEWSSVLSLLWSYTDSPLDKWQEAVSRLVPRCLMEMSGDTEELQPGLSAEKLRNMYLSADKAIIHIIELIYYMGTCELYGKISGHGQASLERLSEVIRAVKCRDIQLPEASAFLRFSFEENGGWGERFDRRKLSRVYS